MTQGFFITFEGLEGAGKSTQAEMLARRLEKEGYPVLLTREPGGTPLGEAIRRILKDHRYEGMDELAEVFLFAAARRQHVEQVLRPSLAEGTVVICDRFCDATLAYQGYGRGVHLTQVREINEMCAWNLRPDLTFYLDIEPYQSMARVRERMLATDEAPDRLEKLDVGFFERTREGYLEIAHEEPVRVRRLDATMSPDALHQKIVEITLRELHRRMPHPQRLTLNLDDLT
ncbi:MAG TPA: dTMP kinase [Candidatus Nitrosotenuis sp.]|jgi:dTMP kinase|nr:dTMP kinase [Candidatus Nitrosotenuis sp.]